MKGGYPVLSIPTEDLAAKKRHMDAARVLLDYAEDVREGIKALVEGSQFSEARRIVSCVDSRRTAETKTASIDRPAVISGATGGYSVPWRFGMSCTNRRGHARDEGTTAQAGRPAARVACQKGRGARYVFPSVQMGNT